MGDKIGFYQSCSNMWSVGRVSVCGLRWYGWFFGGGCLDPGSGRVGHSGWCYICLPNKQFVVLKCLINVLDWLIKRIITTF